MSRCSQVCARAIISMTGLIVSGCGGSSAKTVTATDVTGIPAGDATGTTLSGTYLLASAAIEDCTCRVGSCAMIHAETGTTLMVVQQDGALTVTDSNGNVSTGGVKLDDTFTCGGVETIPSAEGQGEIYALLDGTFQLSAGQPTAMTFQISETITGSILGVSYDCDFLGSGMARYEGP
jgi:hypothetical protein